MKPNKPIVLYIPSLIVQELDYYLIENPPNFKYQIVCFYYVIHYITNKLVNNKDSEYIKIDLNYLKKITVSNIRRYIAILRKGGFVIVDNFIPGVKSFGYKINECYFKDTTGVLVKPDSKLFQKIKKKLHNRNAHNNTLEPFLKQMRAHFMSVDVDYQKAEKWIKSCPDKEKQYFYSLALMLLQDKRFRYFKRNRTNMRLDTNLTNLPSGLKQFIKGDFVNIDLKNSQPFFFSQLIKVIIQEEDNNNNMIPLCCKLHSSYLSTSFGIKPLQRISLIHKKCKNAKNVNLKCFSESVIRGTLYNDFIKSFPESLTRDEVKLILLKVLFSRNRIVREGGSWFTPYDKEKKIFASVFPFVAEAVNILKEKDHAKLAIYLQRLESYIFIDCIAKELVNNGIIPLTIHDSVIIKSKDKGRALEIMQEVFYKNFGIIPTFHIKQIKQGDNNDD